MTATKIARMHGLLQQALEVELFTIPPYLTALYSIIDGSNAASVRVIQSVVVEEMLHASLVANLMNAIGAPPRVIRDGHGTGPDRVTYPAQMPHIDRPLVVDLLPFSKAAVASFLAIEKPDIPSRDWGTGGGVATIGQLYARIRNELIAISEAIGEAALFGGDPALQLDESNYYGSGGQLIAITDLDKALLAVDIIAQQGEGRYQLTNQSGDQLRFAQPREVAHYFRFEEIANERYYVRDDDVGLPRGARLPVDWRAVRPIGVLATAPPPGFTEIGAACEATYAALLEALHRAFNGEKAIILESVPLMQRLKVQATEMMRIDIGGGRTATPPFWFMRS